jgi:hypothetical protein
VGSAVTRDWSAGKPKARTVHPEPQQRALVIDPADHRVGKQARQIHAAATKAGWEWLRLSYARGNDLAVLDGVPVAAPVTESLVLRGQRAEHGWSRPSPRFVATWIAAPVYVCPNCGAQKIPTDAGVFPKHPPGAREPCQGSGQRAEAQPWSAFALPAWSWSSGYWNGADGVALQWVGTAGFQQLKGLITNA